MPHATWNARLSAGNRGFACSRGRVDIPLGPRPQRAAESRDRGIHRPRNCRRLMRDMKAESLADLVPMAIRLGPPRAPTR
jgi:hypothetical protein